MKSLNYRILPSKSKKHTKYSITEQLRLYEVAFFQGWMLPLGSAPGPICLHHWPRDRFRGGVTGHRCSAVSQRTALLHPHLSATCSVMMKPKNITNKRLKFALRNLKIILSLCFFSQLADLLGDRPSVLDDCLQSFFPPEDMKAVLEHHRKLGHFKEKGTIGINHEVLKALLL